ncbi:hypothetical protein JOC95_001045 [Bacillus tianshenii]|uniref:Uncharacterized protein n=1 Tax=Sutcliffiella tianshenii TaxID=1463404 RepID=A0ABS2NWZ9_9BACI|nr:hypothetical protein [Bacillus tianshenii]
MQLIKMIKSFVIYSTVVNFIDLWLLISFI